MTTNDKNTEFYVKVGKKLDELICQLPGEVNQKKMMDDIQNILQPDKDYTITSVDLKKRNCELFWKKVQRQIYDSTGNYIVINSCSSMQYHYIKPFLAERGFLSSCKFGSLKILLYHDDKYDSSSDDDYSSSDHHDIITMRRYRDP